MTNTQTSTPTTTPLRTSDAGDMLALVTNTFGYTPKQSLVIVGFQPGGVTGAHLRLDLDPALDNPAMVAARFCPVFTDAHEACTVLVFSSDAPAPGDEGQPSREANAVAVLDAGFEAAGLPVVAAWQIGGGYARALDCPDADCCAYPGTPVTVSSQGAYELVPDVETTPADVLARYTTAKADTLYAEEIARAKASPSEGLQLFDAVASGETTAEDMTTAGLAGLLATLDNSHTPAAIATTTTGLTAGFSVLITRPRVTGVPAVADTTGPAPDWARIDRVTDALAVIAPYATGATAANLYAVMAWVSFAKGQGTCTELFIRQALRLDTNNPVASQLAAFPADALSGWAQRAETAYRSRR